MNVSDFLAHLDPPRPTTRGWAAKCPAHEDRSPSLSISEGDDGRILLHCFSGCSTEEIVESMGLSLSDLFPEKQPINSRNHHHRLKARREAVKQAGFSQAGTCRQAEKVIHAATGVDISGWSPDELDRAMNLVCDAYGILQKERGHYE